MLVSVLREPGWAPLVFPMYFLFLALAFWNQTCTITISLDWTISRVYSTWTTRLLSPEMSAILSRS